MRIPGLRPLQPVVQKVRAVTEPGGELSFQRRPNRSIAGRDGVISVLSANLWHDWPKYRRQEERLEQLALLVEREEVDILLLQEVWRTPHLKVDEWLSHRLKMSAIYSRANGHHHAIGFEEGVAILSHLPLTTPRLQQLGTGWNPFVSRLALSAEAKTPAGPLALFSVHLGLLPHDNVRQMADLFSWVATLTHNRPALIGGDFNAHENSSQIRRAQQTWLDTFRHLHPSADGVTHEIHLWDKIPLLKRRLDYIFFKPHQENWQVVETRHLDTPGGSHSDHRAVLSRLKPVRGRRAVAQEEQNAHDQEWKAAD